MYAYADDVLLKRFFCGLTEQTFQGQLGVADPPLIEYLADLLLRFVRCESVFRMRDLQGRRLDQVADMLAETEQRLGDARREVLRHIGDFTLFWTGVYPESLQRLRGKQRQDHLLDYCTQGKRSYYMASTIPADSKNEENAVLQRLSYQFEMCAYGLGEVRREWERHDWESSPEGPRLIR